MNIIYDTEIYLNCFLLCAEDATTGEMWSFEVSPWKDDTQRIAEWVLWLKASNSNMIGFNNLGFDYPLLHALCRSRLSPKDLYNMAKGMMDSDNKFAYAIYPSDRIVPQIDLFKIHHFDNKARMTGLKALEFNMRLDNISDLPFPPGSTLNQAQIDVLKTYCAHDVTATKKFYEQSKEAITFRQQLALKYPGDVLNYSDVKIGKTIFQSQLEASGVECYVYTPDGREPKQTRRMSMDLSKCIPPYVQFEQPEFQRIKSVFANKIITETKGAFKDMSATVGGTEFFFGTGGIHASVENEQFVADEQMMILDVDVTSMYPSIAIENGYYPEHLGEKFVEVYRQLKAERVKHPKGSVENAAYKLALNGVYGATGDPYSIFYDPLYTMKVTVGGQLMMAMLAEQLLHVEGLRIIQANTDGVTLWFPRSALFLVQTVCKAWEDTTRLTLEHVEYARMWVADVNSYLAEDVKGNVKRKGRYEYDLEWHQNASALVVPKVAEQVLLRGVPIRSTLEGWLNRMDFMLRVKVPRSSHLIMEQDGNETQLENTQRYYVSEGGGKLIKVMPPLAKDPTKWRRIGIESGWTVCSCNAISDAKLPINYDYYQQEVEKLCLNVM